MSSETKEIEDLFPEETCRILKALAKKKNRLALKTLMDKSVKDEDAEPELLKILKGLIRTGMVSHKCLVGVTKEKKLVVADCEYSISELGKATLLSIVKIWEIDTKNEV